jgi:sugar lactone lactonase YvrE
VKSLNIKFVYYLLTFSLIILLTPNIALSGDFKMWTYATLPEAPEGVAIDSNKNLYVTMPIIGQVVLIKDDGSYEHVAWVPSKEESGQGEIYGLDVDTEDNIYVAYTQHAKYMNLHADIMQPHHPACHDTRATRSGVYKIDAKTHKVTPVATRAEGWPFCFPDDVDIDKKGNIYLSDLTYAGIWKISPDGKKVTMWNDDPLLNWGNTPLPLGVNVVVLDKEEKNIFAATTTQPGRIVKIPIKEDGSAGKAVIHSAGHAPFDGIAIDDEGYIYASEPSQNQIIVVPPQAGWAGITPRKVIAKGAPLQGNCSLVFRDGVLYTANLAYGLPKEKKNRAIVAIQGFSKE